MTIEKITATVSSEARNESQGQKPFMMNFLERQQPVREPRYNFRTQLHSLVGSSKENIAKFTTTAIPNHRDTA